MDRMLTLSESAAIARCSAAKLYRLARSGEMPYRKIGSTWMISESQLRRALGLEPLAVAQKMDR